MRATAPILLAALVLAGCGGGDGEAPAPVAAASPTPPPTEELKYDLLTAEIQLDAYRFSEGVYTDDEKLLGPAFPGTVTVKEADRDSFYMAAYDAGGIRYAMVKEGKAVERTCKPADDEACPDGEW